MASPRTRRLKTDYELLSRRFANWPLIKISASAGLPPEHYRFVYCMWTRPGKSWSGTRTCWK
jgi:hypothetical protein